MCRTGLGSPQSSAARTPFLHITVTSRLLGILRGDKTAIIHAAAKAEQAFAYLKSFGGAADDSVRDEPTAAAALAA